MKANIQDTYGRTDAVELRDNDQPDVADDDMAGTRAAGWRGSGRLALMPGLRYPVRLAGYGSRAWVTKASTVDGMIARIGILVEAGRTCWARLLAVARLGGHLEVSRRSQRGVDQL